MTHQYVRPFIPEWEFVQGLAYKEQTPEDAEFVKLVYTIRLRKVQLRLSAPGAVFDLYAHA